MQTLQESTAQYAGNWINSVA